MTLSATDIHLKMLDVEKMAGDYGPRTIPAPAPEDDEQEEREPHWAWYLLYLGILAIAVFGTFFFWLIP